MSVIVTDAGFAPDDFDAAFDSPGVLDLPPETDPSQVDLTGVTMIRVSFPSFADGRGLTIARELRQRGYTGRLRAAGHVLSDQYAMARRSGFDEVEISQDQAARQPASEWKFRANWQQHHYQARLRA